jgi:hypothetical protein
MIRKLVTTLTRYQHRTHLQSCNLESLNQRILSANGTQAFACLHAQNVLRDCNPLYILLYYIFFDVFQYCS